MKILLDVHHYIGNDYYNEFVITADDMAMNIILYNFANNYSNIDLPGYLYNIRKISMSNGEGGIHLRMIRSINYLLYFEIFYKYIKDFKKERNFLFYEMKNLNNIFLNIKKYNIKKYIPKAIIFLNKILNDNYLSSNFKNYLKNLLITFQT